MKRTIAALLAGTLLLTGCAGSKDYTAQEQDGSIIVDAIGMSLSIPQDWNIYTGDEVYEEVYPQYSDSYSSASELREYIESAGEEYIAYAVSEDNEAMILLTAQDMTVDGNGEETDERITAEDFARTVHDSSIFEYLASGFRTGSNSSFSQETIAGREGWLSFFEVYIPQEDDEPIFLLGQEEFMFQEGDVIFSIQLCYSEGSTLRIENLAYAAA